MSKKCLYTCDSKMESSCILLEWSRPPFHVSWENYLEEHNYSMRIRICVLIDKVNTLSIPSSIAANTESIASYTQGYDRETTKLTVCNLWVANKQNSFVILLIPWHDTWFYAYKKWGALQHMHKNYSILTHFMTTCLQLKTYPHHWSCQLVES